MWWLEKWVSDDKFNFRRLFTEHHISASLVDGQTKHHLQIQAYRGGGNTTFFLSGTRIHPESGAGIVAAVQSTYPGAEFQVWQCAKGNVRADCFFIKFLVAPARLHKQVPLEPNKLGGGYRANMAPVDLNGKCRNPVCRGAKHPEGSHCGNTVRVGG